MSNIRPDGEYFADQQTKPIPLADTWENLSANQLLDIQIAMQQRLYEFRQNPAVCRSLGAAVSRLQYLIDLRLSNS